MRTYIAVERHPGPDHPLGLKPVDQLVQIHRFALQRPPQPLNENVVQATARGLGGRLPLRIVGLPAPHLLSLLAGGRALDLDAEGPGTEVSMRFAPDPGLVPPAKAMLAHCPRA